MKLYKSTEKSFLDNGFGNIQAISCLETKKKSLNGWYIECKFPIKYINILKQDRILYVETKEKSGQAFRINNIKCTDRYIELTANHVVFDAERYLLDDVRPTNLNPTSFLKWCNKRTDTVSPFSVSSNVNGVGTRYFVRKSLLECFSEAESLFGGVFDANNFDIQLLQKVGNNNGYSIIYGKNLQSVSIVEDWSSVVTKLLPVGPNGITLTEKYLQSDIQYEKPYTKTVTFDVPTSYEQGDSTIDYTPEQIKSFLFQKAFEYLEQNKIPKINYTVASDVPQELCIGDTITIKHPLVEIKTEVQSYQYDVIAKRVKKLEFGNYDKSVKKIFDSIKETIKKNEAALNEQNSIIQQQSDLINKLNKDGYVYIDENEILILDTLPKEKAKNVWRFGLGGIGFSSNGINGPFESALTQDGTFNTNFIKANSITVNHLSADIGSSLNLSSNSSIQNLDGRLDSAELKLTPKQITMAVNTSIGEGNSINSTDFTLDKYGVHIQNGGLDIKNNYGTTVLSADLSGNLVINNLTANNGDFNGNISSSTFDGGYIKGSSIDTTQSIWVGNNIYLGQKSPNDTHVVWLSDNNYIQFIDNVNSGEELKMVSQSTLSDGSNVKSITLSGNGFQNNGAPFAFSSLRAHLSKNGTSHQSWLDVVHDSLLYEYKKQNTQIAVLNIQESYAQMRLNDASGTRKGMLSIERSCTYLENAGEVYVLANNRNSALNFFQNNTQLKSKGTIYLNVNNNASGIEINPDNLFITTKGQVNGKGSSVYFGASDWMNLVATNSLFFKGARISASTNITISSDARMKNSIIDKDCSDMIDSIKVKEFSYNNSKDKNLGIIAQDLVGTPFQENVIREDSDGYYSVDYNAILMALVQKVQKLEKRIIELEKGVVA